MSRRELRRAQRLSMVRLDERLSLSFDRGNIEMRAKPNGTAAGSAFEWTGYAAVYDADFPMYDRMGEPYTESVAQGACKRSLANPNLDVPFVFGHSEWGIPFARTKSGTMQLSEDSHGLLVHVPSMDGRREEVRALASAVERGDVSEMSLAFVCNRQEWDPAYEHRTVQEMDLNRGDVSAVIHGANPATDGANMFPVEQLMFRRPAAIGGPVILGRERRAPTQPYSAHPGETNECPQCRSVNDDTACYCDQCGTPMRPAGQASNMAGVEDMNQGCPCGHWNSTDAKFCGSCGRNLTGEGTGLGYYADGRPLERRASAADDVNTAVAPDYDPAATDHPQAVACGACDGNGRLPHPVAGADADGPVCPGCNGTGAVVTVDDQTGIPGPEEQLSAGRDVERMRRELELEELARPMARTA